MITPETINQPVQLRISLPEGKTLADVTRLSLNVFPTALPDGTVATVNAAIN